MLVLARNGVLQEGMKITLVDRVLKGSNITGEECKATVLEPNGGWDSIEWHNERYSPSSLLAELESTFHVRGVSIVCRNWKIVGHEKSIFDEANESMASS